MINILNNTYVAKSFYCLGSNLSKCFDCKYCRIQNEKQNTNFYGVPPTKINPNFNNVPVAVNLFYGDPLLQIDNTVKLLRTLEKEKHKGAVLIVTKGDYSKFPDIKFDLDLHIAFSTFGINHEYDGNTWDRFISNLNQINKRKYQYKYSIEFRPICYQINDDYITLEKVIKTAHDFNLPIGYSGLQGKPDIVKCWNDNGINLKPYPNFEFGHLKPLSDEVENNIRELSQKYTVPVFHKTSCLISYVHNYERDYNCHYYRPDEVKCDLCPMKEKCISFKNHLTNNRDLPIPFDYEVQQREKYECTLKTMGLCKYPTESCSNISGYVIKIHKQLTAADYRMIKWLTGYAVDATFTQDERLSDEWFYRYSLTE